MAFFSKNSRTIINNLKSKAGLSRLMKQSRNCCSMSCLNNTNCCRFIPLTTIPQLRNPDSYSHKKGFLFCFQRFQSTTSEQQFASLPNGEHNQELDFPGGKVVLSPEMQFLSESPCVYNHCYRVLDDNGQLISNSNFVQVSEEIAVKMYSNMATLQILDTIFYEAQRQGRISFYVTTIGEEAINIASAAALKSDDIVFPQYREPGVLLWRGFTLQEFANQCFGNKADYGKGRQMPVHYGSNKLNYFTVASTIATQIPHAVGAAYSLKMDKKDACAVTYFGDGGTSEGDFHAALNFAAVTESPVIFICRNNGWAISTPTSDQFRSEGIAVRGQAYGVRSIRVDGNDALAMYSAVHAAREMAINEHRPILVEAVTYRVGHHSTSDDSTKYRPADEIEWWKMARDPVTRFRKWIEANGWWGSETESQLRSSIRNQLLQAIQIAERAEKPPVNDLFTDVYDNIPSNLHEQEKWLRGTINRHPKDYPADVPV
ncbi:2-oxoisovalerate dehydrogenase subunit alpha 2 [Hibiscus syriacus]|uniref:3-methyl-2-oxobutanoate dehydrogenase (2-methylpropanoyl-transferring) n=1 Tax=Hibiscus syriacus TaxID=106335 RepID=A0A6A2X220_HIBSY|nr:2-oxoisovalerate dehydrogenase subunit alpha 2, mitochondrial-like [Hibiscus syriacus]KAE8655916.1 2-oxoisovalerate dehydrogenase subunit alpha 2 [Hibiscus syriacus]